MRVLFRCGPKRKPHRRNPVKDHHPTALGFTFGDGDILGPTLKRAEHNENAPAGRRRDRKRTHIVDVELTKELLDEIQRELAERYTDADGPLFEWSFSTLPDTEGAEIIPRPGEAVASNNGSKKAAAAAK